MLMKANLRPDKALAEIQRLRTRTLKASLVDACIAIVTLTIYGRVAMWLVPLLGSFEYKVWALATVGAMFILAVAFMRIQRRRRQLQKIKFLRKLVAGLLDDLLPGSRIRVVFDLRAYDAPEKLVWLGTSSAGNLKVKYRDKWLRLSVVLVDGSQITIKRQRGVKTKMGSIVREKRRLFLAFSPNPARYDLLEVVRRSSDLGRKLERAIVVHFQDPPQEFHARAEPAEDAVVTCSVSQINNDIWADEVLVLIRAAMASIHACAARERS